MRIVRPGMLRKKKKSWKMDMAAQRIERLFDLAQEAFDGHPELSRRYVFLARKISMRHRVRIPGELSRKVCKGCGTYLVPGATSRTRTRKGRVVTTCLECDKKTRISLKQLL